MAKGGQLAEEVFSSPEEVQQHYPPKCWYSGGNMTFTTFRLQRLAAVDEASQIWMRGKRFQLQTGEALLSSTVLQIPFQSYEPVVCIFRKRLTEIWTAYVYTLLCVFNIGIKWWTNDVLLWSICELLRH